jgi:hypothetical protein
MHIQSSTLTLGATNLPDRNLISTDDDDSEEVISTQNPEAIEKTQNVATENLPRELQQYMAQKKNLEKPEKKRQVYYKALTKWSKNDVKGCVGRVTDYVDENTANALLNGPGIVGGSVLAGAAVGAGIGAGVGFAVGGPPGIIPGALIGAGAGAGMALTISLPIAAVKTRELFIYWKRDGRLSDIIPALVEMYECHHTMVWVCPLTTELFEDPVFIPSGITYEKNAISNYLALNEGSTMDPCQSMVISNKDLYTDFAMLGCIFAALEKLAQQDLKKIGLKSHIRQGLVSALRELGEQVKECESNGRALIKYLWDNKKIEPKVYKNYQEKLNTLIKVS